ncbi:MAG: LuxR C-terminal-related transcriptional regulator [Bacteroidota bacterium]
MRNIVITFGIVCLCSLVLLQMAKVAVIKNTVPIEIIIGGFAGIFLVAGILIARRPAQRVVVVEAKAEPAVPAPPVAADAIDRRKIEELGISKREYEVLCEIALGLSNVEIAEKLFVSESTIKTHTSNLLMKLDAKRRTEAVATARELRVIN